MIKRSGGAGRRPSRGLRAASSRIGAVAIAALIGAVLGLPQAAFAGPEDPSQIEEFNSRVAAPADTEPGATAHSEVTPAPADPQLLRGGSGEQFSPLGGGLRGCITIGHAVDLKGRAGIIAPSEQIADLPVPEWCLDLGVTETYYADRSSICGILSGEFVVEETSSSGGPGAIIGSMNFNIYHYVQLLSDMTVFYNKLSVSPSYAWGAAVGTEISATATCWSPCDLMSASFPVQVPALHARAEGEAYAEWDPVPGESAYVPTVFWDISFRAQIGPNTAATGAYAPGMRCDDMFSHMQPGCVVPWVTPSIEYDAATLPEFAAHVYQAQLSGLAGSRTLDTGPLTRLTDETLRDLNRAEACPASYPRPSGKSCDEYPFASTWEGALFAQEPQTYSWCQIELPAVAPPHPRNYSVCMIDALENSYAGSLLEAVLYRPKRVLEWDPFYVEVIF
ncbi:NucA/NucB deoxyribonuclease domain-containing protein [Microbacterium invictum]|uniref:Deoxyribonuclease NucA/NucB domain-containing protein n=1 Tax=Microbacterium invictum TaxID=515415 RepID=A0AA40SS42_9MICO|nr:MULTISPECIES: hypothetical protein [Microbacterium]MBB4141234.1 hypothetical protein [Microbacterium invictum]